jgi:dolichyl-phosphate beta-glucosyltransferase
MQGMLCSRGQLLLMLDSDGATKFSDLEKLEYQVCDLSSLCSAQKNS